MKKKHQHKIKISVPIPDDDNYEYNPNFVTGKIYYKNYEIGIIEVNINIYPPLLDAGLGSPHNVEYKYTILFNNKYPDDQLNIALNSIQTTGFYKIVGFQPFTRLLMPVGNFMNIGYSPSGTKYKLKLMNNSNDDIELFIKRICK